MTDVSGGPDVLVVEDAPDVRELVMTVLSRAGYRARSASDGRTALAACTHRNPDLVVLDLGLPDMEGLELLRLLRSESDASVLLLTGRSGEADMLVGLSAGADDYMVKPFSPRELVARISAMLRRPRQLRGNVAPDVGNNGRPDAGQPAALGATAAVGSNAVTAPGALWLDADSREVRVGGELVTLTRTEFDLLAALSQRIGRVWTREALFHEVWSSEWGGSLRLVEAHMSNLRRKLNSAGLSRPELHTVRGVGYRLIP